MGPADSARSREAPVQIVEYDPNWPAEFRRERAMLRVLLAPWLAGPIEHIGSTAVPGLAAKPVIDIMAAVASLDASRAAIGTLREAEYVYFPYRAEEMHWFCKPDPSLRTHHLHLVPRQDQLWQQRLAFRNALRANRQLACEYADLKRTLAERFRFDREGYTSAKGAFVARVLADQRYI